ncbi:MULTISPECIES: hypothetical protein [unclassified Cyanobium]|uniref:hypothetical protein n=1 Tax=unclassified Cyanobium TaxID=2627006 RepID=UPI0020CD9805|nr:MULTISPECIES: hypothetical protein [unclassified Cyanobium]MCP9779034.1 hypothetical protein [Cyanobium sp. Tous-M-B4]MCP9877162.1 hypothetical protein [Cyanobium sp. A2C-AMD]
MANEIFEALSPSEEEHLSGGGVTVVTASQNVSGINLQFSGLNSPQILVKGRTSTVIDLNVGGFSSLPGSEIWDEKHVNAAPNPAIAGASAGNSVGPG